MERERKWERIPKIVWIVLLCNFHNFSGNKQRKTDLLSENGLVKSAQSINSSLVVGDEIADHRKSTHRRWDELRSLSFLRWDQIDFERIFWDELTKMSFPFCILILDFILTIGNFEISSIKGCDRMRWKMFKFGTKISVE